MLLSLHSKMFINLFSYTQITMPDFSVWFSHLYIKMSDDKSKLFYLLILLFSSNCCLFKKVLVYTLLHTVQYSYFASKSLQEMSQKSIHLLFDRLVKSVKYLPCKWVCTSWYIFSVKGDINLCPKHTTLFLLTWRLKSSLYETLNL